MAKDEYISLASSFNTIVSSFCRDNFIYHIIFVFLFFLSSNAVLQLHTDVFTFLQHCCYVVVCRFVRSLMAFVCQEIKGLLTYLLTYLPPKFHVRQHEKHHLVHIVALTAASDVAFSCWLLVQ